MMMFRLFTLASLILTATSVQLVSAQEQQLKHVTAAEFNQIISEGNGQLIDIRTPAEYNMGHIKGAIMIDFYAPTFKSKLSELDKNKPVYIYCRSGNRTSHTVSLLQQLGFKEIINLQRGLIDWQRGGFQLTQE